MYVNCTNHPVTIITQDGNQIVIQPSKYFARSILSQDLVSIVDDIPIFRMNPPDEIKGLPPPQDGITYIVSANVAQWAGRSDVVSPNHAPDQCIRDMNGKVIAVRSFIQWTKR